MTTANSVRIGHSTQPDTKETKVNISDIYDAWDKGDTFRLSLLLPTDRADRDKLVPDVVKHAFGVNSDDPRIGMIGADLAAVPAITSDALAAVTGAVDRLAAILTSEDPTAALATAEGSEDPSDPSGALVAVARDTVRAILTGRKQRTRTSKHRAVPIHEDVSIAAEVTGLEPGTVLTARDVADRYGPLCEPPAEPPGVYAALASAACKRWELVDPAEVNRAGQALARARVRFLG